MKKHRDRVPEGTSAGGQFAARGHSEASVSLEPGASTDMGTASPDDLRALVEHPDPEVRAELVTSPRLPDDVLVRLSEPDQEAFVRVAAANTGYPGAASRAAQDRDPIVRAAALGAWDISDQDRRRLESDQSVSRLMGMIAR